MKDTTIQQQITLYTERLKTMKENRSKEENVLTDEQVDSFDKQIVLTAEFIRCLKQIESVTDNVLEGKVNTLIEDYNNREKKTQEFVDDYQNNGSESSIKTVERMNTKLYEYKAVQTELKHLLKNNS